MTTVSLTPINETFLRVGADRGVLQELYDYYSYKVPGAQFMPLVRNGLWDGQKHLLSLRDNSILRGLQKDISDFCEQQGYTLQSSIQPLELPSLTLETFLSEAVLPHTPRDFQIVALNQILAQEFRALIESATGSGKSLVQYLITAYAQRCGLCEHMLIIVPTIMLADQLADDFCEYGKDDPKFHPRDIHKIYSGKEKTNRHPITISTWQSLANLDEEFFTQFDGIIVDECHLARGDTITKITSACTNAALRVGVTGTLDDDKIHHLVLKGLFGEIFKVSSAADLMDQNILAQLTINCIILKYGEEECKAVRKMDYQSEIDYIIAHERRNKYIANLANSVSGNKLILVNRIEHGEALLKLFGERPHTHFISGKMKPDERTALKKACEESSDMILIATYGVFQLGVNIVNLDRVIFASPSKSKIQVLQSIGRCLRRSNEKTVATVYDLVDDFQGSKKRQNYLLKHYLERFRIYCEQKFLVKTYNVRFEQ